MVKKRWLLGLLSGITLGAMILAGFLLSGHAGASSPPIQVIDDSTLQAMTATIGGASPLPTDRTIAHWFGQTTDPNNGVTYGYNMVGADPNRCSGSACSATIEADITPVIVNIDGLTFSGSDVRS